MDEFYKCDVKQKLKIKKKIKSQKNTLTAFHLNNDSRT